MLENKYFVCSFLRLSATEIHSHLYSKYRNHFQRCYPFFYSQFFLVEIYLNYNQGVHVRNHHWIFKIYILIYIFIHLFQFICLFRFFILFSILTLVVDFFIQMKKKMYIIIKIAAVVIDSTFLLLVAVVTCYCYQHFVGQPLGLEMRQMFFQHPQNSLQMFML